LGENVALRACLGVDLRRLGLLAALLLALVASPLASASVARQQSSIVIDYDTGEVLHAVEPDAPAFPASLTKMMTLYLVFEAIEAGRLTPDTRLKVSARAAGMPPTKLGLRAARPSASRTRSWPWSRSRRTTWPRLSPRTSAATRSASPSR
jgi:D-alanyl-D-alanine carboxypeptidase